eukprot:scaffold75800_cov66-Phaeocystis_antarctica.AAC.3
MSCQVSRPLHTPSLSTWLMLSARLAGSMKKDFNGHPSITAQLGGYGAPRPTPASTLKRWLPAVPELGACALSGRAWQLWATRHSKRGRPGHWAPSHCLGCLERAASKVADSTASEPPGRSPTRTH